MRESRVRLPLLLLVALLLQHSLLAGADVQEVRPDVLLLLAVVAGIVAGPERGALVGFMAGLATDLFVVAPFGLSALTFSLIGYAVGSLQSMLIRASWWIAPATCFVASAAGVGLYAVIGGVVGQSHFLRPRVLLIGAVVGVVNMVLAIPAVRAMSWALAGGGQERSFAR